MVLKACTRMMTARKKGLVFIDVLLTDETLHHWGFSGGRRHYTLELWQGQELEFRIWNSEFGIRSSILNSKFRLPNSC
jgi:hypothetical protein